MLDFFRRHQKRILLGLTAVAVGSLAYMYRRRRLASIAQQQQNKKAAMGGLVVFPVGEMWGTRPAAVWQPRQATVVAVTLRGTGTLAALAVVWENIRIAPPHAGATSSLMERAVAAHAAMRAHPAISSYKLDTLKEISTVAAPAAAGGAAAKAAQQAVGTGIFTHVISSSGLLSSAHEVAASPAEQELLSFLHVTATATAESGESAVSATLVELVIDPSFLQSDEIRRSLCRAVDLRPVVVGPLQAQLVATVPQARCRLTVPAAANYVLRRQGGAVLALNSALDATVRLTFDETLEKQVRDLKGNANKLFTVVPMTDDELIATPRCGVTLIHSRIGVELPFLPGHRLLEPRYGATDAFAVLFRAEDLKNGGSATQEAAQGDADGEEEAERALLSFELWSDAPELWFNHPEGCREADREFLAGISALLLPQGTQAEVAKSHDLVQMCGHDKVAVFQTRAEGRHCCFAVFRRGIPQLRAWPASSAAQQQQSNANSAARQIVVVRFEDADYKSVNAQIFEQLLDGCNVAR